MCGIAGFITRTPLEDSSGLLKRMGDSIAHRGPDDAGYFETHFGEWHLGFAFRRLAIIDPAGGHQPLANEDGSIQIVFNGEIYNFRILRKELEALGYRFVTQCDTEVIVHAYQQWGAACVERLRGMFGFALWDRLHRRVFFARDRFGKKPLFIFETADSIVFASEIKALLKFPGLIPETDAEALWSYFAYRYVPGPATLFKGVRKLMPGSWASWENGRFSEHSYYVPPDRVVATGPLSQDPVGSFLEKLDDAVCVRMMSDVPFGAFLSGGLDSSAVVALMARHSGGPIKTFSVGFAESAYSELTHARAIAQQFETEHQELVISEQDLIEHLPALVRYRDAPVSEPSDIPIYLLARAASSSVKMVLTGEGSDELLGGYPKHVAERYVRAYQAVPRVIRRAFIEPMAKALPYRYRRAKTAILNMGLDCFDERMPRWFGALSDVERLELLVAAPDFRRNDHGRPFPGLDTSSDNSALRRILYFDQTSWLPDNLLERGDRMTMAASIEARMPFMDHQLAEFVSSLPDYYRVRLLTTKWLLREAMKRLLPASILERPKVGFRVPVNEWFRTDMREYLFDNLTGPHSRTSRYYRKSALVRILNEHMTGLQNHEKLLWCLLNLEIWHQHYMT